MPPDDHSSRLDQIADATRVLFDRYGYRRTSMDDIARETGVAKATLYAYYDSKEAVFRAMLMRCRLLVAQRCDAAQALQAPLLERLVALLDANFGSALEWFGEGQHWGELRMVIGEINLAPSSGLEFRERLAAVLERADAAGEIRLAALALQAGDIAEVLIQAAVGAKHQKKRSLEEYRAELRKIGRFALAALSAPAGR